MNLRNRLALQFIVLNFILFLAIVTCIFASSTYMDKLLENISNNDNGVPIGYQVQYMIIILILSTISVLVVAIVFGKLFGSPLLHMLKWLKNLANQKYQEPTDKIGIPLSQQPNGQLKRNHHMFYEVIYALQKLTDALKKNEHERELLEKTREDWMTGISHDLKTPISVVKGYAELLSNENYNWSPKEINNFANIISERMDYMESLVEDFNLTFQLKNQSLPLKKEKCNIVELVRIAVVEVANIPGINENYTLVYKPELESIYSELDYNLFKRAIHNLVANAIKHNPVGTNIEISVTQMNEDVNANSARIVIKDNGVGMDEQTKKNLFNRYYIGSNTQEGQVGSGLGMAISKQIVQAHGGSIEVKSILGKGTTCLVYINI